MKDLICTVSFWGPARRVEPTFRAQTLTLEYRMDLWLPFSTRILIRLSKVEWVDAQPVQKDENFIPSKQ